MNLLLAIWDLLRSVLALATTAAVMVVFTSWITPSPKLFDWTIKQQRAVRRVLNLGGGR